MNNTRRLIIIFLLGILISTVLFSPFILDFTLLPRFVFLAIVLLVLTIVLLKSDFKLQIQPDVILVTYFSYVIFSCASFFWALNKAEALFEAEKVILSFGVFAFTFFFIKTDRDYFVRGLLKCAMLIFFMLLMLGLYQIFQLKKFDKESLYGITGMNGHKNLLASFLFLNLFFLITAAIKFEKRLKILAIVFSCFNLLLLMFLQTKAVWMGLMLVFILLAMFTGYQLVVKKRLFNFNVYVATAVFVVLANVFFLKLLQPIIDTSISPVQQMGNSSKTTFKKMFLDQERLTVWQKTYTIFHKRPLLGVGLGNWQIYYPDATLTGLYRCEDLNFTFQRPHNDFLWILSELGIIGFNLFLVFMGLLLFFLIKCIQPGREHWRSNTLLLLSFAFILGYFLISFFDFPKERVEHLIWLNLILGFAYSEINKRSFTIKFPKAVFIKKSAIAFCSILMLFIAYSGMLRYKGEYFTRKLYTLKAQKLNAELINVCHSIISFCVHNRPYFYTHCLV